jgi:hypothetical protein
VKYGVNVVFTGHEHFYERIKPQKGIAYFIAGAPRSCAKETSSLTDFEAPASTGYTFMVIEIVGDDMYYQVLTDAGKTIDSRQRAPR